MKQIDMGTSRLSALPSLSRRNTERPTESRSDNIEQRKIKMPKAKAEKTDETFFGDIGQTLHSVGETIDNIRADIGNCVRCPLHQGRTQIVHTKGNFQADLMFVGEAPGADEDAKGEPFVGRAGQLLTKIIESIGMRREDVVIGNINRCRPPSNRQPTLPEAETCRPFLLREIAVVQPKVIVVMGNTALHNLLETKTGITRMR
ncbi:MAG: uracil-DNA glycosylase [Acidobacteriota bacterium]|nr:uracil-DNA glycosylase [Acidobacteriota bacterium]